MSARRELLARLDQLRELYDRLPTVACQGLCGSSCEQRVWASRAETVVIAQLGVDLAAPSTTGACSALRTNAFGQRRCSVHQSRPMICRLWGVATDPGGATAG